jgi:two-component system, OmpR family, response regulator PrrA
MPQMQRRILIIDDESNLRRAVEVGLRLRGFQVDAACDAREAILRICSRQPDAIVLDIGLPDLNGVALLPLLRQRSDAPVVMLTARADLDDKLGALHAGADDYLTKPFEMDELKARLMAHLRRRPQRAAVLAYGALQMDIESRRVSYEDSALSLSPREFDLLVVLLQEQGRVFRKTQLLDRVWGVDADVGNETVDRFVSLLRAKLEAEGRPRLIQTVRGVGYVLREEAVE